MTVNILSLSTALGADVLQLNRMHGVEAVGELFSYQLEMSSPDTAIAFADIVGKSATVSLALEGSALRIFNGVVTRFTQTGGRPGSATYRAEIRPWLWWLTLDVDARIYQQMTAVEIITGLFTELGFTDFKDSLSGTYTKRDYCVQYNETAFDFVSRLMEEEGIFYYFEHAAASHTMVLLDDGDHYKACPGLATARYQDTASSRDALDLVFRCEAEQSAVTGKFESGDYNFEKPALALKGTADGAAARMRVYQYPGGYTEAAAGTALAAVRMQALEQTSKAIRGESTCRAFVAGCKFSLAGHVRADMNTAYVLRRVSHEASTDYYSNSFEAYPLTLPFRSPLRTPRARIYGTQTATVVGKAGEEIWTDEYGRVKVQFHWDQRGKKNEESSCWIRVAQGWAGQGFGAFFLPRIGQEVIVSFLDGDPDRPLVTGGVYNATQKVPEPLPANQTRSGFRSQSSKGGGGANEIRFEDKKDSEELYLHAQKDMTTLVENDRASKVAKGNDTLLVDKGTRSVTVGGDETHASKANFTHTVTGNYELTVDGNLTIKVSGSVSIKAGTSLASEAGTALTNKAGTSLNNTAGTSLENKAGTTLTNDAGISMTNKASASQTVDGGGMLTLKGGIVKIN
ncbi:MAG: type VI secretion system tip protein TssI/VgrG [Pseudomonadota bacterium]